MVLFTSEGTLGCEVGWSNGVVRGSTSQLWAHGAVRTKLQIQVAERGFLRRVAGISFEIW